jgi:hypothetical protein
MQIDDATMGFRLSEIQCMVLVILLRVHHCFTIAPGPFAPFSSFRLLLGRLVDELARLLASLERRRISVGGRRAGDNPRGWRPGVGPCKHSYVALECG